MAWQYWVFIGALMLAMLVFAVAACRLAGDADISLEQAVEAMWEARHGR